MKNLIWVGIVALNIVACGGGSESLDEVSDGLSTAARSLVSVRRDARKCAAPACGGYFVRSLNSASSAETYVARFDYTPSGFDSAAIAQVEGAPAEDLVLYGKLSAVDPKTHVRTLLVTDAYRGLPGVAPAATDSFLSVTDKSGSVQCVASPCMNQTANRCNGTSATAKAFSDYSVEGASKAFVDQDWLVASVKRGAALVAGSIVQGAKDGAAAREVLAASQVYLQLPAGTGPCNKLVVQPNCAANEVVVYTRDENRCLYPAGCAVQGPCPQMQPACEPGYTLQSWKAGPNACNHSVCDPTFSL